MTVGVAPDDWLQMWTLQPCKHTLLALRAQQNDALDGEDMKRAVPAGMRLHVAPFISLQHGCFPPRLHTGGFEGGRQV
jgi:hypothetical protein